MRLLSKGRGLVSIRGSSSSASPLRAFLRRGRQAFTTGVSPSGDMNGVRKRGADHNHFREEPGEEGRVGFSFSRLIHSRSWKTFQFLPPIIGTAPVLRHFQALLRLY